MSTILGLLDEYEDYLKNERQLASASITAYLSDLQGLAGFLWDKQVGEIEVNDLRAYMRHLGSQGYKATSIIEHNFGVRSV